MRGEIFFTLKLQTGEHKEKLKIRPIINLPWLWSGSIFNSLADSTLFPCLIAKQYNRSLSIFTGLSEADSQLRSDWKKSVC